MSKANVFWVYMLRSAIRYRRTMSLGQTDYYWSASSWKAGFDASGLRSMMC